VTSLRGTCPPDIVKGLWSRSLNSVAPDNSSNISKAVNKGKDTCLPPGNDLQNQQEENLIGSVKKGGRGKLEKNPVLLDLKHAKT